APRQTDALGKTARSRVRVELGNVNRRIMPGFHTAQSLGLGIEPPEGSGFPTCRVSDGLKDFWRGSTQARRFCQHLADRVLHAQGLLRSFALRDERSQDE